MAAFTLRDHLATYPGGVVQLARDCGKSVAGVYAFAAGAGKRVPVKLATAIAAKTSRRRSLDGVPMTREWLLAQWEAARAA